MKYDGFRILITHVAGEVKLLSRRGTPYHDRFPELVADIHRLPELAIDGELVRRSRMTKPISIQAASRKQPAVIFAFDLLELNGWDSRKLPLLERKALLQKALEGSTRIRYVEHVDDGLGLFAAAEEAGLEGIVSKKAYARYRRGKTGDWVKVKTTAGKTLVTDRGKWNER